jgi:hypothetical protein
MSKVETAVNWAIALANDNKHGYDQANRWGPDYDCSSSIITAYEMAGVPVKAKGATYTGNMYPIFKACGFKDITSEITLSTGRGLIRGDVLLNVVHHTAMYIGGGKIFQASINELGHARGGQPGDQTGREIYIRQYYNYPWNYVLRYEETNMVKVNATMEELKVGSKGNFVKMLQSLLNLYGCNCGTVDGDFGGLTDTAVKRYQSTHGLSPDGDVGTNTWGRLLKGD